MKQPILPHGGDWAGYEAETGALPLDFSANISPLGVPPPVRAAIAEAARSADRYPDPLCRRLCAGIAAAKGVMPAWVLCGGGAADLIWRLALAARPRRALVLAPTFGEYAAALRAVGCTVEEYPLTVRNGFALTDRFLSALVPGIDLVVLCEPNNPTGRVSPPALLQKILARCRAIGARLAVDECFGDFLPDPAAHTLIRELCTSPHLILLQAFTKSYAMAGVRLGYALCADTALLDAMRSAGPPWAVSTLAQAAGLAALREEAYLSAVRALIAAQRPVLAQGLLALGLRVVDGQANYLLFQCSRPLLAPLRERGILLRSCANYTGLDDTWYRTAVRTAPENRRLLAALREIVQ